jgi:flagellin
VDGSKAKTGTAKNVTGSDDGLTLDSTTGISVTSTAAIGTYSITESGGDLTLTLDGTSVAQTVSVAASGEQEVQFDELGITLKLNSNFTAGELGTAGADIEVEGASQDITLQIGADNSSQDRLAFNLGAMTDEGLGISLSKLGGSGATITDAQSAINQLDTAIAKVNDERSNVGALQNRLEFTSSNLMNSIQNNAASMSTIRDADFAAEAADLAKNQILVQSGTSMLAQANSLSQNVLALIR